MKNSNSTPLLTPNFFLIRKRVDLIEDIVEFRMFIISLMLKFKRIKLQTSRSDFDSVGKR
jgi:hypothetical protein